VILVTVGTYAPFERLIKTVDAWAARRNRKDVVAQIGRQRWSPQYLQWTTFLTPQDLDRKMQEASAVISHAGAGTIIRALELGKPLLVMPRRRHLHEVPSDHQLALVRHAQTLGNIAVALDEEEMSIKLDTIDTLSAGKCISPLISDGLLEAVRAFINDEPGA